MNGSSAYGDCDMTGKHVATQSLMRTVTISMRKVKTIKKHLIGIENAAMNTIHQKLKNV